MRPIPLKMRRELADDPFMKKCCITGSNFIQWHHVWTYGKCQINEKWSILPVSEEVHEKAKTKYRNQLEFISLQRAIEMGLWNEVLMKYPKKNWEQEYARVVLIETNEVTPDELIK